MSQRTIHEGWVPAWPDETCVVWIAWDPNLREPPVVFGDAIISGEPTVVAAQVHRERDRHKLTGRSITSWAPPKRTKGEEARDWQAEYARMGIHLAPCEMGRHADIRGQRLQRDLDRRVPGPDGTIVPGLRFTQAAQRVIQAIRKTRPQDMGEETVDVKLVNALTYALTPIPERWRQAPEDPLELGREAFGTVGMPAGYRTRTPGEHEPERPGVYGDPDWV